MTDRLINPIDRNSLLSKTFNALKWILALLVVVDHFGNVASMLDFDTKDRIVTYTLSKLIAGLIRGYQVPLFFVMSGFLFCFGTLFDFNVYRRKLRSRIRSLGVPYLIFLIWGFAMLIVTTLLASGRIDWGKIDYLNCLTGYRGYPVNVPLWYLRDLFLMVLLSPVVHRLLTMSRGWILLPLGLFFIISEKSTFLTHFSVALFFFTTGYAFRLYGIDILRQSRRWWGLAAVLFAGILALTLAGGEMHFPHWVKHLMIILSIPIMVAIVSYLVEKRWLPCSEGLVAVTFFIYLSHHPFRDLTGNLYALYWPGVTDLQYVVTLTLLTVTLLLLLATLHRLLRRHTPSLLALLTGSR